MFEEIGDHAVLLLDPDGRVASWNASAERLLGYRADEIVGRLYEALFSPDDVAAGAPHRQLAIAEREGRAEAEGVRRRKDGSLFVVRTALDAVRDAGGGLRGFAEVAREVAQGRTVEEAGGAGGGGFAAAGLAFWDFDATSPPSLGLERMLDGLRAQPSQVHPDDRARLEAALDAAASGRRALEAEFRIVRPDGRIVYARAAASLMRGAQGRPERLSGVSLDVTAQREAEIARDAAEAANRAKSEFLATMSHEVRTPLNGIVGMNALLLESGLTDRQRKMAAAIRESAEALIAITDQILDISKLEAGRMEIEESDFDLRRLIEASVELFTPIAREKSIGLVADAARVSRAALRGDALRLRQVLLNLVSNAVKFTSSGSVAVVASTEDEAQGRVRVRIEVLDDGPGVDARTRQRLFKPFEQASGRFGGTGLGLSISKRLVDLMTGRIGMDERPQGGSVFWFEVVAKPASGGAPSPPVAEDRGKPKFSGRILLAEDNPINAEVIAMILEDAGYAVDVAVDGAKAIDAVARRRYDLVLMDLRMPLLDGLEATRSIRALAAPGAHLPIVAMTASATPEDRRRCLESGMDHYISKPFTPAELIENVSRWIARFPTPRVGEPARAAGRYAAFLALLPIVDEGAVEGFRAIAPDDKFIELLGGYLEHLDGLSQSLTQRDAPPSTEDIGKEAHKLIMGSGTFGARQVQELALLLQAACNSEDAESVAVLTQSLLSAAAAASAALCAKYRIAAS